MELDEKILECATEKEEESPSISNSDVLRRRVTVLRLILRQAIFMFHGRITAEELGDISHLAFTRKEIDICCLIANFIMPYIPEKENCYNTAYQLPFILMVNDLKKYTRYEKSCVSVLPTPKPSTLHCLKIDAPSIFSMFCAQNLQRPMELMTLMETLLFAAKQLLN